MIRSRSVKGPRRSRSSIQAALVAALLGAAVVGSATLASRLTDKQPQVLDAAPDQPPALMVTANHLGPTPLGDVVTSSATPTTTTTAPTTTTRPPTTTTAPPSSTTTQSLQLAPDDQQATLIAYLNAIRGQAGCDALTEDGHLDAQAQQHAVALASGNYRGHGNENTAKGDSSAQQVIVQWMRSQHAAENIVNCDFTIVGVGMVSDGGYWIADFGQ